MLDTHARGKFEFLFCKTSDFLIKCKLKPTHVSVIALFLGLISAISFYFDINPWVTIGVLWLSGFLDAVDGSMARKMNQISKMGTLMDVVFDRIVEISIILAIALRYDESLVSLLFLSCSIILSITVFLTTGTLAKNTGKKSFHYQVGVMERTEGFIFFTLMIIFIDHIVWISYIFATLILFTAIQRFFNAKKLFSEN